MEFLFAYVDPGTGATLTQLLLAGSVGIAAVLKLKWHSIRNLFGRSNAEQSDDSGEEVESEEESTIGNS